MIDCPDADDNSHTARLILFRIIWVSSSAFSEIRLGAHQNLPVVFREERVLTKLCIKSIFENSTNTTFGTGPIGRIF